ncbi:dynein regulatory complex protein 1-like [Antennarius striatus]|uniref:dynein regulatory complex protein 1-like n=1 Tax=Antennarius striatus TaxID=241820 RepID=UPI0035AFA4F3
MCLLRVLCLESLTTREEMIDHLHMPVINIQRTAEAKESTQRLEVEEARRLRLGNLEDDGRSSQAKLEAITRGWSVAEEKVIPQDLQEALVLQQESCAALIETKEQLISDLQQELKDKHERSFKELSEQQEELDLMKERMEDQIQALINFYRKELVRMEKHYLEEWEDLLTSDGHQWEKHMKELVDKERGGIANRRKTVEDYEATIHDLILENMVKVSFADMEHDAKFQNVEREKQQINAKRMLMRLNDVKLNGEAAVQKVNLGHIKTHMRRLEKEAKTLLEECSNQDKRVTRRWRV